MTNIEKSIQDKAELIVNHFMQKGSTVSKKSHDIVVKLLTEVADELVAELKSN